MTDEDTLELRPRRRVPVFGRARPLEELLRDGAFPYQVGRLVGAAEVVAFWLQQRPDVEVAEMGAKLHAVCEFFYVP